MKNAADALAKRVSQLSEKFTTLDESQWEAKPNPSKWSKKEILGHLTDSAHNNLNRFVRAQYENVPHIVYDQDQWVSLQNYQSLPVTTVIHQWQVLNGIIVNALYNIDVSQQDRQCDTGKSAPALYSLKWLADDYLVHLDHHAKQILG